MIFEHFRDEKDQQTIRILATQYIMCAHQERGKKSYIMYYGGQLYNRSYVAYWHTFFFFKETGKSYLIIVRVYTTIAISGLKGHSLLIHRLAISFTKH